VPINEILEDLNILPLLAGESNVPRRQLGLVDSIHREPGSAAEQHKNQQREGFHRSIFFFVVILVIVDQLRIPIFHATTN
jgi:hypothetical protein